MLPSCPSAHPPACLQRSGQSFGFPPVILTYFLCEVFLHTLHSHQNLSVTPEGRRSPALSTCLALQRPHQVQGEAAEVLGSTGPRRVPVPSTRPVTSPIPSPCCQGVSAPSFTSLYWHSPSAPALQLICSISLAQWQPEADTLRVGGGLQVPKALQNGASLLGALPRVQLPRSVSFWRMEVVLPASCVP